MPSIEISTNVDVELWEVLEGESGEDIMEALSEDQINDIIYFGHKGVVSSNGGTFKPINLEQTMLIDAFVEKANSMPTHKLLKIIEAL